MRANLQNLLLGLPSVQSFVLAVSEDLMNSRSVVALLPPGIPAEKIWSSILSALRRRSYAANEIAVAGLQTGDGLAAALAERLGVVWPTSTTSRTVGNLLRCRELPEVIQLDGINFLPAPERSAWLRLMAQWAQVSQNIVGGGQLPTALCALLPAQSVLPLGITTDVRLGVHWWWGFPSALELRLLCRIAPLHQHGNTRDRWLEHILPALAGSDLPLIGQLWECADLGRDALLPLLREFAEQQGWSQQQLREWGAESQKNGSDGYRGQSAGPPKSAQLLWANGSLSCTPEYGVELSAAALAALAREKEIWHRLWRGQAELLLPLLDQARLVLCEYLTERYGRDWPVKWFRPDRPEDEAAVRSNPLACQWGYLEWLIWNCTQLRDERRWLSLITPACQVRNAVAHYEPVGYDRFDLVLREFERFTEYTAYRTA